MMPFSFCRFEEDKPLVLLIDLNKKMKWLSFARIPYGYNLTEFLKEYLYNSNMGILIDGFNEIAAFELSINRYEILKIGKEAIFDLQCDHFNKKSLKELTRRGSRGKKFEEIPFSVEIRDRLRKFRFECSHGKEPQLKNLFNDEFNPFNRLFVIKDESDIWYGAFMLSNKEKIYAQTELILRRKNSPVGVMEALIYSIFNN